MILKSLFSKSIFIFFYSVSNSYSDGLFSSKESSFLKVDEAFKISIEESESNFLVNFDIADGYYLYKEKIKIIFDKIEVKKISFPKTKIKEDEFFGKSEIYDKNISLLIKNNQKVNIIEVIISRLCEQRIMLSAKKEDI